VSSGARGSTDVETPPAPKRFSPWDVPSDRTLDEIERCAVPAKRRLLRSTLYPSDRDRAPVLSKIEIRAIELWDTRDYEWYWKAKESGVPRLYWRASLDQCIPTAAVAAVREFYNVDREPSEDDEDDGAEDPRCLGLCGGPGTGKTYAAVGGMRNVRGQDLAFFDVRSLSRALMDPARRDETLARALEADTLVLDDVGATYIKQDGFLESLIEESFIVRETNPVETIFTTNLTRAQLEGVMGHRVADRLAGPWASVVELRGAKSLRRERP